MIVVLYSLPVILTICYTLKGIVYKEKVYITYAEHSMYKLLRDKCSVTELRKVLAALDVYGGDKTGYTPNMNRSTLMIEILKVQVKRFSQWEFEEDERRSIKPYVDIICEQNYDIQRVELMINCTTSELHKIIDYMDAKKTTEESKNYILVEDILNEKRENILLNTTFLIEKFCVEQKLTNLADELHVKCSGKRIKQLFKQLTDGNFYDILCTECNEKAEYVAAVVEVKRRYFNEVRIMSMIRKFCVEPELESMRWKLADRCTGGEIKVILMEIVRTESSTCIEKSECIEEVVDRKRQNFKEFNINPLIHRFCLRKIVETSDDERDISLSFIRDTVSSH